MGIRLNKYLAQCGLGSRRKVEELITAGRITINGKKVRAMGTTVAPSDSVGLDGRIITQMDRRCYLMLNKPPGYVTTLHDEKNRPTVMDLIPEKYKRLGVYPVGRLDKETGGILLFTNDGDLAYKLTKPRYNIPKEYVVEIDRPLAEADKDTICRGMYIHQLQLKTKQAEIKSLDDSNRRLVMVIREGKNRQIRYTFMNLGYKVRRLDRTGYGRISLKNTRKGSYRTLTENEIRSLQKMTDTEGRPS